jgi:hypothetical protein
LLLSLSFVIGPLVVVESIPSSGQIVSILLIMFNRLLGDHLKFSGKMGTHMKWKLSKLGWATIDNPLFAFCAWNFL